MAIKHHRYLQIKTRANTLGLFGLLLILAGCGTNPGIASPSATGTVVPVRQASGVPVIPTPASDFAFVFRFGLCSVNELDTFSGRYTRGAIGMEPAITIPVSLTKDELAQHTSPEEGGSSTFSLE